MTDAAGRKAVAGLLLAGGRSVRMGVDKAFLDFEGLPLWCRQTSVLSDVAAPVLVAAGSRAAGAFAPFREVVDTVVDGGPLAGIEAGLASVDADFLVVLAVDMPLVTPDDLRELVARSSPGCGCFPEAGGFPQGLCACYPRAIAPLLCEVLAGPDPSMRCLIRRAEADGMMRRWMVPFPERFANWNTPGDCGR